VVVCFNSAAVFVILLPLVSPVSSSICAKSKCLPSPNPSCLSGGDACYCMCLPFVRWLKLAAAMHVWSVIVSIPWYCWRPTSAPPRRCSQWIVVITQGHLSTSFILIHIIMLIRVMYVHVLSLDKSIRS
jgi:hypothetical protein